MNAVIEYAPLLWQGLLTTLMVTVLGGALCLVVAFAAGLARLSRHRILRWPAGVFIEVFRGTSLLVQMFWLFFALPFFGIQLHPLTAAVLALGLNEGAYAAEVVRGAIASRAKGQTEACIALGMEPALRLRRIIIPQSIPAMLPPFGNVMVDLLKNTSLVSLVTVADLTFSAQMIRSTTGQTTAIFTTILVMYFVLSYLLTLLTAWLEKRFALDRKALTLQKKENILMKVGAA
ncbi:ectoine/hydroxyectoine ABC transporter permease subunit EhuC [Pseudarthrobacter oxydans]|uniref:ectoine/hydroxyectoine ABC transporter permease subunit EhuC n=1 Tax=Pseudarthrobacter oxydans TaxID=1671 RepID=UPI002AA94847|nr:ectoine/hydroxyectoine ABC transporter permease subunit EhuC [Pseudarthrobacter oxydans]WPU09461.1 ectoine/hydroxyectoine ABC transporter permease subunit EhuC [Pseudarthrobacter oxydans]